MSSWRPLVRIARRDAARARGRSALVLVMIALPVLMVTAADVVIATADVRGQETIDRTLGAAQALVRIDPTLDRVAQGADPDRGGFSGSGDDTLVPASRQEVAAVLGRAPGELVPLYRGGVRVRTDAGVASATTIEADPTAPELRGLVRRVSGRWPRRGEVAVNQALLDRGFAVGGSLRVEGAGRFRVVGVAESADTRAEPVLTARPGQLGERRVGTRSYLVGGDRPVTWDQVRALNDLGVVVTSRAVLLDPPPASAMTGRYRAFAPGPGGVDSTTLAVAGLVVAMALLEVVLLAGPAFAVGARRQSRTLALITAAGGTPRQARRLVLAGAVVLGGLASVGGVLLGVLLALAALPVVQGLVPNWFGPLDVRLSHLLGIGGFGLASALLAALAPAVLASRQDAVAVLAGRRGEPAPSRRAPLLGLAGLAVGVVLCGVGAYSSGSAGSLLVAVGAVVAVLAMILVVPVLMATLARLSARLPLSLRYAARDADRHRTRTVPAVAAVSATVAGVVALGIANASDAAEARATYQPTLPHGALLVTSYASHRGFFDRAASLVERDTGQVPTRILGPAVRGNAGGDGGFPPYLALSEPGRNRPLLSNVGSTTGTGTLVSDTEVPAVVLGLDRAARADAAAALRSGRVVVLTERRVTATRVRIDVEDAGPGATDRVVPAHYVRIDADDGWATAEAVLPTAVIGRLGLRTETTGLYLPGPVTDRAVTELEEGVAALDPNGTVTHEQGYVPDQFVTVLLWVLGALGGTLVLGGTLTATLLALSDARPDLATLGAVGATPGTRRRVAAAYALVIGLVGAALGAVVGAVPGFAIAVPLTATGGEVVTIGPSSVVGPGTGPFFDVPWLLVGTLVLALPLASAALVGLVSRSRLPMVARLE